MKSIVFTTLIALVAVGSNVAGPSFRNPVANLFADTSPVAEPAESEAGNASRVNGRKAPRRWFADETFDLAKLAVSGLSDGLLAGTALQFDGSNQYVTFGDTRLTPGTLAGATLPTWNTTANSRLGSSSLTFNGSTGYVTTGTGTAFNSATFTVETWFYRTAAGTGVTTGTGGIASAIPLLTKGTSESETASADVNYFLGIDATSAKLVADFEEGAGGTSPSLNHPIVGTTTILNNTWYHAAATYDGNKWQLFLNGNLENELVVGQPANAALISPLALGTSIRSNGTTTQGFFAGRLDEARVWNFARTQAEISGAMNSEILVPTTGLLGRWGLNDRNNGAGTTSATASNLNGLGVTSFTLEAWVKRSAGGASMSTGSLGLDGSGGRPLAYPVLAKGMGEGEQPTNINTNWFLGITTTGVIGADFEDNAGGVNRPAWGTTTIPTDGSWHHVAATYDGNCWALYLDGNPDALAAAAVACPNATPESTSYQRAALSAGISSTGSLGAGYFSGVIDEARVWNRALTPAEILSNQYLELTAGTGLIARWGLGEGSGSVAASSVGTFDGTLTNGPTWVNGFPDNVPPGAPTGVAAANAPGAVDLSWTAPADPDVAGYNVYRGTTPGFTPGTALNGVLITGTTFSDSTGILGTPYYYVVRTVDTSGNLSPTSSEVSGTPLA
ncbi:MAG TPA: hypothetical protein PKM58_05615, partial [Pyrinomonadaceae bacterium]|nr:hypothetical protein [Pyrinomonadaceae bacterium]